MKGGGGQHRSEKWGLMRILEDEGYNRAIKLTIP